MNRKLMSLLWAVSLVLGWQGVDAQGEPPGPAIVSWEMDDARAAVGDTVALRASLKFILPEEDHGGEIYLQSLFVNVAYDTANVEFLWADRTQWGGWILRENPFEVASCNKPLDEEPLAWLVIFEAPGYAHPPCDRVPDGLEGTKDLGTLHFRVKKDKPITVYVPCAAWRDTGGPQPFQMPGIEVYYAQEKEGNPQLYLECYEHQKWMYYQYYSMDDIIDGHIYVQEQKARLAPTWSEIKGLYRED